MSQHPPYLYLEEGQRDGTVRQDIDPLVYTAMGIESFVAFAQHTAVNANMFNLLYQMEQVELLDGNGLNGRFRKRRKKQRPTYLWMRPELGRPKLRPWSA